MAVYTNPLTVVVQAPVRTTRPDAKPIRQDIQALRGFAVIFVILFHTWPAIFPSGFLGVDMFFTISGYLITGLVSRAIQRGEFTFQDFYGRRFRRLLPAAYATFLLTAVFGVFLLTARELNEFVNQLTGAVTFCANVVLWRQAGYFDRVAEFKPLLHIWSLAIEEVGALALSTPSWKRLLNRFYWPSVTFLLLMVAVPLTKYIAGFGSAAVCLATLVALVADNQRLSTTWAMRAAAAVGGISYSLYLVHWPLAVFLRSTWAGPIPPYAGPLYLAAAILLGLCLFAFVERPLRRASFGLTWTTAGVALAFSVALIAVPAVAARRLAAPVDYANLLRPNVGLAGNCDGRGRFEAKPECQTSPSPSYMIWGDSLGMHLAPGLADSVASAGMIQATRPVCGPFLGLAPMRTDGSRYNREWAQKCTAFNQSVLDYLRQQTSVHTVVLASAFRQYVIPSEGRLLEDGANVADVGSDIAVRAMRRTVEAIRALGKRVVVISPPPNTGTNLATCLERRLRGMPLWGPESSCTLDLEAHRRYSGPVIALLERFPREADVEVIRLDEYLCRQGACSTTIGGELLYLDELHFSYRGSQSVARQIELSDLIQSRAR